MAKLHGNDHNDEDINQNTLLCFNNDNSTFSVTSSYCSTSSIRKIDLIPPDIVYDLCCIAKCMVSSSYLGECIQVHENIIEKLSIGIVQRLEWEQLKNKIKQWIRTAKVCVRTFFANEKKLCKKIFNDVGIAINDACFMETIKRLPKKLFKILDLHDALIDLMPDINVVFDLKSSKSIRVQAAKILSRLGEVERGILFEYLHQFNI
ncbi:Exocyst complex component EXO70B1 [Spatholobus suberectus]|nr:Exocyst complex component EXO70B1 [Spatholobus suberectus]